MTMPSENPEFSFHEATKQIIDLFHGADFSKRIFKLEKFCSISSYVSRETFRNGSMSTIPRFLPTTKNQDLCLFKTTDPFLVEQMTFLNIGIIIEYFYVENYSVMTKSKYIVPASPIAPGRTFCALSCLHFEAS